MCPPFMRLCSTLRPHPTAAGKLLDTPLPVRWLFPLRDNCQIRGTSLSHRSDVESEPSACQNYFLMESSLHNNPIQSNNHSQYISECVCVRVCVWSSTVSIQLGKDFDLPEAQLVKLHNKAVTPEGEKRPLQGWRPIVWRIDKAWCNRLRVS